MTMLYAGTSQSNLAAVPADPCKMEFSIESVSASTAGRSQDSNATMHVERMAQKRKIALSWQNTDTSVTSAILHMFIVPEYVWVRYLDPVSDRWEVRRFYSGAPTVPVRWFQTLGGTRYSSVSFDIIEA